MGILMTEAAGTFGTSFGRFTSGVDCVEESSMSHKMRAEEVVL